MGDLQPQPQPLSAEDQFYHRQLRVPGWGRKGQETLKNSSVLVVGAGGLGCPALLYLAGAGVGRIGVADRDTVSLSNLPRQILFTPADVGNSKALTAKTVLEGQNPWIRVEAHDLRVDPSNLRSLVEAYDLVVDASDNFLTKYLLHDGCRAAGKPLVMASLYQWEAQIQVFDFRQDARGCLRCLYPQAPEDGCVGNCDEVGVAGALAGSAGSLQALAAVQILLELDGLKTGETLLLNFRSWSTQKLRWNPDPQCPCCSRPRSWDFLNSPPKDETVRAWEFPREISWGEVNPADWPVVVDLREPREIKPADWEFFQNRGFEVLPSPFSTWDRILPTWESGRNYLLLCARGIRSLRALDRLEHHRDNRFISLRGGMGALSVRNCT